MTCAIISTARGAATEFTELAGLCLWRAHGSGRALSGRSRFSSTPLAKGDTRSSSSATRRAVRCAASHTIFTPRRAAFWRRKASSTRRHRRRRTAYSSRRRRNRRSRAIAALDLDAFIDDLPEILRMPGFPARTAPHPLRSRRSALPAGDRRAAASRVYGELGRHRGRAARALWPAPMTLSAEPLAIGGASRARARDYRRRSRVEPLPGGRNNRVFRVELVGWAKRGAEDLFPPPRRHARSARRRVGLSRTCAPPRAGLDARRPWRATRRPAPRFYGFVEGARFDARASRCGRGRSPPRNSSARSRPPGAAQRLRVASEACFSIAEHVAAVDRRVCAPRGDRPASAADARGGAFRDQSTCVPPGSASETRFRTQCRAFGLDPDAQIDDAEIIASPSDFGFHNALQTARRPVCSWISNMRAATIRPSSSATSFASRSFRSPRRITSSSSRRCSTSSALRAIATA